MNYFLRKYNAIIITVVLLSIGLSGCSLVSRHPKTINVIEQSIDAIPDSKPDLSDKERNKIYQTAIQFINKYYYKKNNMQEKQLPDDVYILTSNDLKKMIAYAQGKNYGFGFSAGFSNNGQCIVISVDKNSPAYNAGIREGNIIEQINEMPVTKELLFSIFQNLIKTSIMFKDENNNIHTVTIKPKDYSIDTIVYKEQEHIGIITVKILSIDAYNKIKQALQTSYKNNDKAIILDLTKAYSGSMEALQQVSSLFFQGKVAYLQDRNGKILYCFSTDNKIKPHIKAPVIVLISKYTRGASELLAQDLKERNFLIIGEKTAGDTTGKEIYPLPYNYYLYLPNHIILSSHKNSILSKGVTPSIFVPDNSNIIDFAIDFVKENISN